MNIDYSRSFKSYNLIKDISKLFDLSIYLKYTYVWIFYSANPLGLHKKGRWTNDGVWGTNEIWHG